MERKLLPTSCYIEMDTMETQNYPVIKFGEYENYIQKFVCGSEEELCREIKHAVRFGVKKTLVHENGCISYQMEGLLGTIDSFNTKAENFILFCI